jgi:peptidoglycan/LPS O-acetylase OafA/YrhL
MVAADRSSMGHRRDIQGLRAVAVLLVIADHAGAAWLPGGFVGVDVFFVISGFLITRLLVREADTTGRVRIGEFYARRARRILPAATLVVLATMVYAASELSLSRVQQLRADATWSVFFAANVRFARLGTDYFAQGLEPSPFQHFWSLAVEEQFYLVWPILLGLFPLVVVGRGWSPDARTRGLTGILVAAIAVSLAWSLLQTAASPGTAYYASPARAWELAIGALLAVQEGMVAALHRRIRWCLGGAGLLAVLIAAVGYGAGSAFPGWRALLPVLGAAAIIAAGTEGGAGPSRVLTVPPLPWLGDLSYSLYLWHWPIVVFGVGQFARTTRFGVAAPLLAATLLAGFLTYHLVENPIRRSPLWGRGSRALFLWPVAVGIALVSMSLAEGHAADLLQARMGGGVEIAGSPAPIDHPVAPEHPRPAHGSRQPTATQPPLAERLADALRAADAGAPVPFPLTNLPQLPEDALRLGPQCVAYPEETSTPVCPIGQRDAHRTMVVLGDSQVGEWIPAIDHLGRSRHFQVLPLIKLGCSPFDVPLVDGSGADYWQCTEFRRWAADYITDVDPDLVLVGSEATSGRLRPAPGLDLEETWAAGVSSLLDRLVGEGARVVVLGDTPDLAFDPVACLTDPDSTLRSCIGTPHEGLAAANATTRGLAQKAGAGYVDTVGLLCARGRCPLVVDRTMTFWDYAHVSAAWAAALSDDFERLFAAAEAGR